MRTASESSTFRSWLLPAFSALLSLMLASTAVAQKDKEESKRKTKETVAMSQQVYESLVEVQELVEAEQYQAALVGITEMQGG